jgi:hypothetical protein
MSRKGMMIINSKAPVSQILNPRKPKSNEESFLSSFEDFMIANS